MRKFLFLLLGLTIAVSASADVNGWRERHEARMQEKAATPTVQDKVIGKRMQHNRLANRLNDQAKIAQGTKVTKSRDGAPTIIWDQPEGTRVYYKIEGQCMGTVYDLTSFKHGTSIVYAPDGETVYLQYPDMGSWLQGTKTGNTITIPVGQYVSYNNSQGYGCYMTWGTARREEDGSNYLYSFTPDPTVTAVTFTVNGDCISMVGSSTGNNGDGAVGLAYVWENGSGFDMQLNTVYTVFEEPTVIWDQPQGELVTYGALFHAISWEGYKYEWNTVDIVYAPDGETVYINNIVNNGDKGGWVSGTIQGNKIHVPLNQCLGWYDGDGEMLRLGYVAYDEYWDEYYVENDPEATEVTFTINDNVITMDNDSPWNDGDPLGVMVLAASDIFNPEYSFCTAARITLTTTPTIIWDQPEGNLVTYERSGYWFFYDGDAGEQDGTVDIVYAPDGETVYIKDIIYDGYCPWIKGTIDQGKIHVYLNQYIYWDDNDYCGFKLGYGDVMLEEKKSDYYLNYRPDVTEVTFTIDGNTISLDNTSLGNGEDIICTGLAAIEDTYPNSFYQCDILTTFSSPTEKPTVIWDQPAGNLVTFKRFGYGIWQYDVLNKNAGGNRYIVEPNLSMQWDEVNVVIGNDGQTVYLQDPVYCNSYFNRYSWVKGTIAMTENGGTITVPLGQYVDWDDYSGYGTQLAWGSVAIEEPDGEDGPQEVYFTPDNSVTAVTYTIDNNGCIFMNNSFGPTTAEADTLSMQFMNDEIDWDTYQAMLMQLIQGTGLAYVQNGQWTGEINWNTAYIYPHPTQLADPVIRSWHEQYNDWSNTYLEVEYPFVDADGMPIFEEALSYSIYTDNDQLYTFDADLYGLEEDATEITYDMWYNINSDLMINYPHFPGHYDSVNGYTPFFTWRIGIQFHYTVNGVKTSTGITYYEVYEKPEVEPGDVDDDGQISISDVTALIDYLLSHDASSINLAGADFDGDGQISISDVTALIDFILTK